MIVTPHNLNLTIQMLLYQTSGRHYQLRKNKIHLQPFHHYWHPLLHQQYHQSSPEIQTFKLHNRGFAAHL